MNMSSDDEIRFEIITNMFNEFPQLRKKVKKWLLEKEKSESNNKR